MLMTAPQQPNANPVTNGGLLLADVKLLFSFESCVFSNVHRECNEVGHALAQYMCETLRLEMFHNV